MRTRVVLFALAAACSAWAGCGAQPPPMMGLTGVTLGGSTATNGAFVPLVDGQDAPLIPGAQGGFHVWMRYRLTGLSPGTYRVARIAHRVSDGQIVLRIPPDSVDVGAPDANGYWESPMSLPMFMCPSPIGIQVVDEQIRYEIDVLDDSGKQTLSSGQVIMVPRCPSDPQQHDFCYRICTG